MTGAEDRASHSEGEGFNKFFSRLLLERTGSCFARDVLRACMDDLWEEWKKQAAKFYEQERRNGD